MSATGIAQLVVADSSVLLAALVYMGWAYTDGLWEYFHLSPLDLGVGVVEYMLRSLALFSPAIVVVAVLVIALTAVRAWDLDLTRYTVRADKALNQILGRCPRLASSAAIRRLRTGRNVMIAAGMAVTLTGLALVLLAGYVDIPTYPLLILLGAGPLMLTRPTTPCIITAARCMPWPSRLRRSVPCGRGHCMRTGWESRPPSRWCANFRGHGRGRVQHPAARAVRPGSAVPGTKICTSLPVRVRGIALAGIPVRYLLPPASRMDTPIRSDLRPR